MAYEYGDKAYSSMEQNELYQFSLTYQSSRAYSFSLYQEFISFVDVDDINIFYSVFFTFISHSDLVSNGYMPSYTTFITHS